MKSLLLTLTIFVISSAASASDIDVSGKWTGTQGNSTISFEFIAEGKNLDGLYLGSGAGDERTQIVKGKVKTSKKGSEINFEVPFNTGGLKMSRVYKGEVLDENTIELTLKTKTRGSREPGFGGFNDGFSGGGGGMGGGFSSGFGGSSSIEQKFVIKRVAKF